MANLQLNVCSDSNCLKVPVIEKKNKDLKVYEAVFDAPKDCLSTNSCDIYLGHIADSWALSINSHEIRNQLNTYTAFEESSVSVPRSFLKETDNKLLLRVKNLNASRHGVIASDIYLDSYSNNLTRKNSQWWKRTGVLYASVYFLVLLCVFLGLMFYLKPNRSLIYVFNYGLVSIIYLTSFSEYPRFFADPELLSGGVHFSLRLLQDVFLFALFHHFLAYKKVWNRFFYTVIALYCVSISLMLGAVLFGVWDYSYHLQIIKVAAPLVAFPMGYALFLSTKNSNSFERKILIPLTSILFIMQLNDLFNFWQIIDSYFTVKFYIPVVSLSLIFIYLSREISAFNENKLLAEKSKVAMKVAHDIKSPVAAMKLIKENIPMDKKFAELLEFSLDRIIETANEILPGYNKNTEFSLTDLVEKLVKEFSSSYPNLQINLKADENVKIFGAPNKFSRVISNLIINSIEASGNAPKIDLKIEKQGKLCKVYVKDSGHGIPKEVLDKMGEIGNTSGKEHGSGLGLAQFSDFIEENNGVFNIESDQTGTLIEFQLAAI